MIKCPFTQPKIALPLGVNPTGTMQQVCPNACHDANKLLLLPLHAGAGALAAQLSKFEAACGAGLPHFLQPGLPQHFAAFFLWCLPSRKAPITTILMPANMIAVLFSMLTVICGGCFTGGSYAPAKAISNNAYNTQ